MARRYTTNDGRTNAEYVADRMDDAVECTKRGDRGTADSIWNDLNDNFDAEERKGGRGIFARRHGI